MNKNRNRGQEITVSAMEAVLIDMMVQKLKAANKRHSPCKSAVVSPREIADRVAFAAAVEVDGDTYGVSIDILKQHLSLDDKEQAAAAVTMTTNLKRVLNGGPLFTEKVAFARKLLDNLGNEASC